MRNLLFLFFSLTFLASCKNNNEKLPEDDRKYPPGDLVFYEAYTQQEFEVYWEAALNAALEPDTTQENNLNKIAANDLRTLIQPAGDFCLGYVSPENQQKVSDILESKRVRACFPKDADILWSWKTENIQGNGALAYTLYVVHKNGIKPRLTGKDLKDASVEFEEQFARATIVLSMTDKGTEKWSEMTSDNLQRIIVMAFNGMVMSAPRVNETITGGQTQISGNFSLEEAKEIVGGIKAGMKH